MHLDALNFDHQNLYKKTTNKKYLTLTTLVWSKEIISCLKYWSWTFLFFLRFLLLALKNRVKLENSYYLTQFLIVLNGDRANWNRANRGPPVPIVQLFTVSCNSYCMSQWFYCTFVSFFKFSHCHKYSKLFEHFHYNTTSLPLYFDCAFTVLCQ